MFRAHTRVRTLCLVLLVAAAPILGGIGAANTTQEQVTLTVTVVDQGGNPLGDTKLSATWDGGGPVNATTASNGKAFVDVPEGADVTIRVDRSFYVRNQPFVVENASEEDVEIELAREGTASITVRDANGRVSNAKVRMFHDGQPVVNARTDGSGEFTTKAIERGEYTLITFKEGYRRNKTTINVDGDVKKSMEIAQDSVLVTFKVQDDHFDPAKSLSNANVTVPGVVKATTQGNGAVTVSVPVNDKYEVTMTKSGYGSVAKTISVGESQQTVNATIQRTPALTVKVDNDRVVVGEPVRVTVTDEYGDPVSGATVERNGTEIGETNPEGVIRVKIDRAGTHSLSASAGRLESSVLVEGVEPAAKETPTATATATAVPNGTETATETAGGIGPGFGVGLSLVAVLAAALLALRRER